MYVQMTGNWRKTTSTYPHTAMPVSQNAPASHSPHRTCVHVHRTSTSLLRAAAVAIAVRPSYAIIVSTRIVQQPHTRGALFWLDRTAFSPSDLRRRAHTVRPSDKPLAVSGVCASRHCVTDIRRERFIVQPVRFTHGITTTHAEIRRYLSREHAARSHREPARARHQHIFCVCTRANNCTRLLPNASSVSPVPWNLRSVLVVNVV